eukprot:TRINITY_DN72929_c0_g1_i1.p1 TRINITY_DN72929_c0_g1~~TRINITY_DN72929_c0_g1_i1.p1  ORF type:complete len:642 (+),score=228.84 TRINITY_DN72929_c0_g1_i1:179-1927(+)
MVASGSVPTAEGSAGDAAAPGADNSLKRKREGGDSGSDSDSSSEAEAETTTTTLRNQDMLNRFVERNSGLWIEADVPEAREVPLIDDAMKSQLKRRRQDKAAVLQRDTGSFIQAPEDSPTLPAPQLSFESNGSTTERTSPVPDSSATAFGGSDMVAFAEDNEETIERRRPMWCKRAYTHSNRFVRLHDEVVDLVKYLRPTHEEDVMRKMVVNLMTQIADTLFPGSKTVVFGSLVTDLVLPTSDVDMTICYDKLDTGDNFELHAAMDQLAQYIQKHNMCEDAYPQVIKNTKVPLVKFTHKDTWIDVDISFNAPNGRVNSEMVSIYRKKLPIITPLSTVIKYFLQQRGMHEPFTGGIGSYATSLMVIAFLQHHPAYRRGADASSVGLGGLLVDFFRFYGVLFRFNEMGIDVGRTELLTKSRHERASFVLLDPQNASNNVTASCRQLDAIRYAFQHAFLALVSDDFPLVDHRERSAEHPHIHYRPTILSRVIHIDHAMLDRRTKVADAYHAWVDRNPTASPNDILNEFQRNHIAGSQCRAYVSKLLRDHGVQDENSALFHGVGVSRPPASRSGKRLADDEAVYEL